MRPQKTGAELAAHQAMIDDIVRAWQRGDYGEGEPARDEKRNRIAAANDFFYGRARKSAATGTVITLPPVTGALAVSPHYTGEDDDEKEPWWFR